MAHKCIGFGFTGQSRVNNDQLLELQYSYVCAQPGEQTPGSFYIVYNPADSLVTLRDTIRDALVAEMLNTHGIVVTAEDVAFQEINVIEFNKRLDIFTGTGTGAVLDLSKAPLKNFALQVTATGALPPMWTVVIEGSLDSVKYSTILTHTNVTGDGAVLWATAASTCLYVRSSCTSMTLGLATNIQVTIAGTQ